MAQIDMPDAAMQPMELHPLNIKKSLDSGTPASRTSVGGPVIVALTPDMDNLKDDPDLAAFLKQSASEFRFFLMQLACTFSPEPGESFEQAWVKIALRSDGDGGPPLAWSMKPDRQFAESEVTTTAKLGADLKLINSDIETETRRNYQLVYLEPLNELQSNPTWHLKSVDGIEIGGCYRFRLVIRAPLAPAGGTIDLSTNIRRKRWGVLPYRVTTPGAAPQSFALV